MKIIKKITATVLVITLLLINTMALAVENVTGTVNTETLRLREEPSVESDVLELLSKDDKVEILEEKDGWYKVKFKDYTGYVSKEFINKSGEVKTDTQAKETTTEGTVNSAEKNATISNDTNLYILPLINSNVITNVKKNTSAKIINIAGGWAYIDTNETSGWIRLDKLSISETSNNETTQTDSQENTNNETTNNEKNDTETVNTNNEKTTSEFTAKNAYIKASAANIRSGASTSSEVVTTLSQNTQIKLVNEENDWYKIEVNGKSGYILKSLVSDKKVETTSRSATPARTETQSQTKTTTQTTKTNNQATNTQKTTTEKNTEESSTQAGSSKGEEVVAYAKKFLGCRYVYGGSGPSVFDCSGFTMYVYKHFGYSMGHSAVTQSRLGKYVSRSSLQPGDLVIFNNSANTSIGHVGIYVGGGSFIHASSGSGKIIISSLSNSYYNARYVTGRRIF